MLFNRNNFLSFNVTYTIGKKNGVDIVNNVENDRFFTFIKGEFKISEMVRTTNSI